MKALLISVLLLIFVVAYIWPGDEVKRPPGVLVTDEPEQALISRPSPFEVKGYRITPLADFSLRARVILTDRYWLGREADLSPEDLTVGWRRMSDQAVLDHISFVRERRAYNYRPRDNAWPIPLDEIISHSTNLHLIPAGEEVGSTLRSVRRGDVIALAGLLVEVQGRDGWHWKSSLSRTDTGPGACELVWVTRLAIQ